MKRRYAFLLLVLLAALAGLVAVGWPASTPLVRSITLGTSLPGIPVVDEGAGRVFITTQNGVMMLDAATGRVRRTIALPGAGQPVVDARLHRLYVPALAGVAALDARTGGLLWNTTLTPVPTMLVVDERAGRLYAGWSGGAPCDTGGCTLEDGDLFTLDARSGRLLRDLTLPRQGDLQLFFDARARRVVALGGYFYSSFQGIQNSLTLIDARGARPLRRVALTMPCTLVGQPAALLSDTAGRLIAGCTAPQRTAAPNAMSSLPPSFIEGIAMPAGQPVFTTAPLSGLVLLALDTRRSRFITVATGPLHPLTIATRLGAYSGLLQTWSAVAPGQAQLRDERNGRVFWSANAGILPTSIVVDSRRGRVYVASAGPLDARSGDSVGPGLLTVLDERNGRVLATAPLGISPSGMALDVQAQRLIVSNEGDMVPRQAPDSWGWLPRWLRACLPFLPTSPRPTRRPASIIVLDTSRL